MSPKSGASGRGPAFYRRYRAQRGDTPATGAVRARILRIRWRWPAAALLGAVLVAALGYWFLAGPGRAGGPPGSVLADLAGEGDALSDSFFARRGWQIEWETSGTHFAYTIRGDVEFGQVINQNGPGNGITSPVPTGTFRIQVSAEGPWSIKVIQGD